MNRVSAMGALGVVLALALALALGCGGGNAASSNDAGTDLGGADDAESDLANPSDGSMPMPCAPAGPSIELVCSGYCSNLDAACTGGNSQFASVAECLTACTAPTWSCGTPADTTGNTVFCRVKHAMAATDAPDIECPQAGPNSSSCI